MIRSSNIPSFKMTIRWHDSIKSKTKHIMLGLPRSKKSSKSSENSHLTLRPFPGTEDPQLWHFVCVGHRYGPWPTFCMFQELITKFINNWYKFYKESTAYLMGRLLTVTVVCTIAPFAKHKLVWVSRSSANLIKTYQNTPRWRPRISMY